VTPGASDPAILATFAGYILAMLGIGLIALRRTRSMGDYLLGGRRLGPWVTALSAEASDMSGWLLLGLPGYAYVAGMEAAWIALGLLLGTWANWTLMAPALRRQTLACGDALTLPEFLARRFPDRARALRIGAAIFILVFFTLYTASGLVAGGKLFESALGLPYATSVLASAAVIVAYTFLGGFLAVSWTDLVQGLLMGAALVVAPLIVILDQGGLAASLAAIEARNPHLLDPFTSAAGEPLELVALASLLGWGLGYFGQPHILARFMAARDGGTLRGARRIAMLWVALTLSGALLVGWAGIGYLDPPLPDGEHEKVFLTLVALLFHPVMAGVLLAAVLAAIMSTADSQLLVASSALAEDLYANSLRPDASHSVRVWAGRAAVLAIAVPAVALAMAPGNQVLDLVAWAWAGFGATFGPLLLFALYRRHLTGDRALIAMITGGVTVLIWKQLEGGLFDLYELVPGFLAATLVLAFPGRRV